MPPKMTKHHHCDGRDCTVCIRCRNPRVVLRPFLAPDSRYEHNNQYHFTSAPATADLFNKPEFSDLRLVIGSQQYYAHRLILCAASDVFAKMLGSNWSESRSKELVLHEDDGCTGAVFQQFLFYLYSGSIMISENDSQVVPLFMLADKYNVKRLYDECVKVIKNGLKVYIVHKKKKMKTRSVYHFLATSNSSDSDSSDGPQPMSSSMMSSQPPVLVKQTECEPSASKSPETDLALIASEAFPLALVIKMLTICQNEGIQSAALYNLEVRLGKHISDSDFSVWNDLELDLVMADFVWRLLHVRGVPGIQCCQILAELQWGQKVCWCCAASSGLHPLSAAEPQTPLQGEARPCADAVPHCCGYDTWSHDLPAVLWHSAHHWERSSGLGQHSNHARSEQKTDASAVGSVANWLIGTVLLHQAPNPLGRVLSSWSLCGEVISILI